MKKFGGYKSILGAFLILVLVNLLGGLGFKRWDLTEDHRFTLSEPSIKAVKKLNTTVFIDVLLAGELPSEFLRLQREVRLLLDQYTQINRNIVVDFVNPLEDDQNRPAVMEELQKLGLRSAQITIEEGNKRSQEVVFPWAVVSTNKRTEKIQLLRNQPGATQSERINNSIGNLEYAFSDAFTKLGLESKKQIAVLKGNGELPDRYLSDYLTSIKAYYNIAPFTLDSIASDPERTLKQLKTFDAAIIAKPTESFSEAEKLVLDQYMVAGGKTLWLLDAVAMDIDSLQNSSGQGIAMWRDLNLDDLLFRYGIRVNAKLVSDMICAPLVLASGNGREAEYNPLPWVYYPIALSQDNHPINQNLEPLFFRFAGSIDTLQNAYTKTVLLQSSPMSREEGVPSIIDLKKVGEQPNPELFIPGNFPLAVLVEGAFSSAYKNRQKALKLNEYLESGTENKLIVISDGDLIASQIQKGQALELGYDPWTNSFYGNKEFLVNCVNYLLEDSGLINIRNKQVKIQLLDAEKVSNDRTYWQLINLGIPAIFIVVLGIFFQWRRKQLYQ